MGKFSFWDSLEELSVSFGLKANKGAHAGRQQVLLQKLPSEIPTGWKPSVCSENLPFNSGKQKATDEQLQAQAGPMPPTHLLEKTKLGSGQPLCPTD